MNAGVSRSPSGSFAIRKTAAAGEAHDELVEDGGDSGGGSRWRVLAGRRQVPEEEVGRTSCASSIAGATGRDRLRDQADRQSPSRCQMTAVSWRRALSSEHRMARSAPIHLPAHRTRAIAVKSRATMLTLSILPAGASTAQMFKIRKGRRGQARALPPETRAGAGSASPIRARRRPDRGGIDRRERPGPAIKA